MLSKMMGKRRTVGPLISRSDFQRETGFGTRVSPLFGARKRTSDIKQLVSSGKAGDEGSTKGMSLDQFTQGWISKSKDDENTQRDMMNELRDIVLNHQTKQDVISALERLSGVENAPLTSHLLPFEITEAAGTYI